MRLNRYLARAGVASRRAADDLIKKGRVTVNGKRGELNTFVAGSDVVEVDGERVGKQDLAHVLLHKPLGVVTTAHDPEGRPTVVDLVGHEARVVPVGRLDIDTSGVILLTNDGDLAHRLAHPRYGVEKTYVADVEGDLAPNEVAALAAGVELEDGVTAPARARQLGRSRVELVLHEGRNRQVRRMLDAVGHPVRRLHRSRYAGLTLTGLDPGRWRELAPAEVEALRQATAPSPRSSRRTRPGPGAPGRPA
jgi:23S rRNA pseudouridine2605 synthase